MRALPIALDTDAVAAFCRRHPISRLSLFGSVLRDDFGEDSDVDFLIELDPGGRVGMFEMSRMEKELEQLVGRKVDLRTPYELNMRFRGGVLNEAEVVYVKGQ